ncbi:mediator of DNA damage checkpoint protein 1-like [Portunus trituberculatus]|uniref:mediator of DNA damage checkpoint protein 1-like n=1 Tax=Portunus trituberculatus TaxID=210409 RepID=UPI001E1CF217|nr:mediator of DNA damage checkpoint protein 1-like [Portunus trituberculatus]
MRLSLLILLLVALAVGQEDRRQRAREKFLELANRARNGDAEAQQELLARRRFRTPSAERLSVVTPLEKDPPARVKAAVPPTLVPQPVFSEGQAPPLVEPTTFRPQPLEPVAETEEPIGEADLVTEEPAFDVAPTDPVTEIPQSESPEPPPEPLLEEKQVLETQKPRLIENDLPRRPAFKRPDFSIPSIPDIPDIPSIPAILSTIPSIPDFTPNERQSRSRPTAAKLKQSRTEDEKADGSLQLLKSSRRQQSDNRSVGPQAAIKTPAQSQPSIRRLQPRPSLKRLQSTNKRPPQPESNDRRPPQVKSSDRSPPSDAIEKPPQPQASDRNPPQPQSSDRKPPQLRTRPPQPKSDDSSPPQVNSGGRRPPQRLSGGRRPSQISSRRPPQLGIRRPPQLDSSRPPQLGSRRPPQFQSRDRSPPVESQPEGRRLSPIAIRRPSQLKENTRRTQEPTPTIKAPSENEEKPSEPQPDDKKVSEAQTDESKPPMAPEEEKKPSEPQPDEKKPPQILPTIKLPPQPIPVPAGKLPQPRPVGKRIRRPRPGAKQRPRPRPQPEAKGEEEAPGKAREEASAQAKKVEQPKLDFNISAQIETILKELDKNQATTEQSRTTTDEPKRRRPSPKRRPQSKALVSTRPRAQTVTSARSQTVTSARSQTVTSARSQTTTPRISAEHATDPALTTIDRYSYHEDDGTYVFGYQAADGSFKEERRAPDCTVTGKYGYVDATGTLREFTYSSGNACDPNAEEDPALQETQPRNEQFIKQTVERRLTNDELRRTAQSSRRRRPVSRLIRPQLEATAAPRQRVRTGRRRQPQATSDRGAQEQQVFQIPQIPSAVFTTSPPVTTTERAFATPASIFNTPGSIFVTPAPETFTAPTFATPPSFNRFTTPPSFRQPPSVERSRTSTSRGRSHSRSRSRSRSRARTQVQQVTQPAPTLPPAPVTLPPSPPPSPSPPPVFAVQQQQQRRPQQQQPVQPFDFDGEFSGLFDNFAVTQPITQAPFFAPTQSLVRPTSRPTKAPSSRSRARARRPTSQRTSLPTPPSPPPPPPPPPPPSTAAPRPTAPSPTLPPSQAFDDGSFTLGGGSSQGAQQLIFDSELGTFRTVHVPTSPQKSPPSVFQTPIQISSVHRPVTEASFKSHTNLTPAPRPAATSHFVAPTHFTSSLVTTKPQPKIPSPPLRPSTQFQPTPRTSKPKIRVTPQPQPTSRPFQAQQFQPQPAIQSFQPQPAIQSFQPRPAPKSFQPQPASRPQFQSSSQQASNQFQSQSQSAAKSFQSQSSAVSHFEAPGHFTAPQSSAPVSSFPTQQQQILHKPRPAPSLPAPPRPAPSLPAPVPKTTFVQNTRPSAGIPLPVFGGGQGFNPLPHVPTGSLSINNHGNANTGDEFDKFFSEFSLSF